MAKRKMPLGYRLEKGDVEIEEKESACVLWIFLSYTEGASLKDLTAELNRSGKIMYDQGKPWNKNMIDRILQDQRYSGDAIYPTIIPEPLFESVQRQRALRRGTVRQTPAQKMIRILGGGNVNDEMEIRVLAVMNHLIQHPETIQAPPTDMPDQTEHFRAQNRLDAIMNQQPIDEEAAIKQIRAVAEAEYALIDSNEYETDHLRRIFRKSEPMDELSADLLRKTVAEISVEIKAIRITLKNHQMIEASDAS